MTWPSHALCGTALALGFDLSVPLCVAGSLSPDLIERISKKAIPHRTLSHSVLLWGLSTLASWWTPLYAFFISGLICRKRSGGFS